VGLTTPPPKKPIVTNSQLREKPGVDNCRQLKQAKDTEKVFNTNYKNKKLETNPSIEKTGINLQRKLKPTPSCKATGRRRRLISINEQ
jgi:hypothetical protein